MEAERLGDQGVSQDRGVKLRRGKLLDPGLEIWNGPDSGQRFIESSNPIPETQRVYTGEGDPPEEANIATPDGDRVRPSPPLRVNRPT